MEERSPKITIATILVTAIILAVVACMFVYGEQPLSVDVEKDKIVIHGMYGISVPFADEMCIRDRNSRMRAGPKKPRRFPRTF